MTDLRIQFSEEMVGAGHPAKADTMNRLALVEHDNAGAHKYIPVVYVAKYFPVGYATNGSVDYTSYIQAAIDDCLIDARRPRKLVFPAGKFLITDDLVIKVKEASVNVNWGQFMIEGQGGGSYSDGSVGTTLICTASGKSILRICEEPDGSYPGGGAGVVTTPLNYMRRVRISDMNFIGDPANPANVNAIVGRGVYHSLFYRCGFYALNYGIRLGKAEATSQETSADGYELDYCEQNTVERCTFKNVKTHVHILAGDTTAIRDNFFSLCPANTGRIFYFSGGNDFYKVHGNIFHTGVSGAATTPLIKAIQMYYIRGIDFQDNHFEHVNGKIFFGSCEVLNFENNLVTGSVQSTANIFDLAFVNQNARLTFENNNVGMPEPAVNFFNLAVIGDDGSYARLKTCRIRYFNRNKVVTALGGTTTWNLSGNAHGLGYAEGRWTDPIHISDWNDAFMWYSLANAKLMVKYGSAPVSDTDGVRLGEDSFISGTIAFPGVTVNAGASGYVDVNASGTSMALSRFIQIAPDIELGADDGSSYLHMTHHYLESGGTACLRIVFTNPGASDITLASGTWRYKVQID